MGLGERIAEARAESGLTQAQLAAAVGLARSALAKIENGMRGVSAVELVGIARELRRRVEWFVDPGPPAIVSYRAGRSGLATQSVDDELDRLARDVEFVAGEVPELVAAQPAALPTPTSMAAADELAVRARTLLKLGSDEPAQKLSQLVTEVGLLPFAVPLGEGADAGTVLLRTGGVSVVNGDLRVGRRRLALAHELGHYLIADPYTTDWRVATAEADALEARLDRFARALLLPESDLRGRWAHWTDNADETLRDAAVRAGSHYQVDMATLARRLEELGLVDGAQANNVRQARTKKADIVEKNLVVARELEPVALPRSYEQAVLRLYRSETVTVDRALSLLLGTFDEDALPDRPPLSDAEIWAVTS
ncbi:MULTISPECIES: helix-turn-helix domain-containing protein [Micromonospora]|uniref:Zn-dependent peptidase ImmA, M78 family n=1 Tax=Micromonospora yangpuensis TaxID=683228 RepID=A0A1C6VCV4_9ACTN|nr:XRE family transcriptional regulator [Micromonospora yangpuensis]GGM13398.1 transcriptional regulator [Micromonospora yangpuensis]SCL64176.1 Zn-dependent peptidase ImmA, M78 family [Micromonospora yangpuensis]